MELRRRSLRPNLASTQRTDEPPERHPGEGKQSVTTTRLETRAALCPVCSSEVRLLGRLLVGEVIGCGSCHAQLEVVSPDPLMLEPLARVEFEEEDFRGFP